jgi:regulation of enolase protein 1 (concanavalin A-like superfamily)
MPLTWDVAPASCRSDGAGSLVVHAPAGTDLFVDPETDKPALGAPRLLGSPPDGDFQLQARVTVDFAASYDAGVLLVWAGERSWAKLCFERSPQGVPMVVSVVTRGVSDDANGFTVPAGDPLWLRIARLGPTWAFHASTDGSYWQLVRYFSLDGGVEPVRVGFEAQSPMGEHCRVSFDDITFLAGRLPDLRAGG